MKVKFKSIVSAKKAKKVRENVRDVQAVETEEDVAEAEVVVNVAAVIVEAIVEIVVTRVKITKILLEAKTRVKEAKTIGDVEIAAEEVAKEKLEGKKNQKIKIIGQTQAGAGVVVELLQVIKLTVVVVAMAEANQVGEVEDQVVATRTTLDMVMEVIAVVDVEDVEMELDVEEVVTVVAIVVAAVVVTVEARANPVHPNDDIWFNATKIVAKQIRTSENSMDYDIAKYLQVLKLNVSCG